MIRIKKWVTKKTKVHVSYEFDHNGTTYEKTKTFAIKDIPIITKETLYPRVRGLVNSERLKLNSSKKALKELAGIGKAKEEGTSGSDHDEVLYGDSELHLEKEE